VVGKRWVDDGSRGCKEGPAGDRGRGDGVHALKADGSRREDAKGEGDNPQALLTQEGAEDAMMDGCGCSEGEPHAAGVRAPVEPKLHNVVNYVGGQVEGN
jgi:hypothetical protein